MAAIELKITNKEAKEIEFPIGKITSMRFKMNSLDDNVNSFDQDIRPEFKFVGELSDDTSEMTQRLAAWALSESEEEIYRKIEVFVKTSHKQEAKTLRSYTFDDMFIVDYDEIFEPLVDANGAAKDQAKGRFELFVAQREKFTVRNVKNV